MIAAGRQTPRLGCAAIAGRAAARWNGCG